MTLLNIVRQKDRIHLLTDGAGLNDRGLVGEILSKSMVFPHLNMAIGFRGINRVGMVLMSSFAPAKSFDDLTLNIGGIVKAQAVACRKPWTKLLGASALKFDIAIVGWHSKKGPTGLFVSSIDRPSTPAFRVVDVNELITPSTDELFKQVSPIFARPGFDVDRDMVAIAEQQRLIKEPYGPRNILSSRVGAFLQCVTVTQDGISSKVIHRWPNDKIGKRIGHSSRTPKPKVTGITFRIGRNAGSLAALG